MSSGDILPVLAVFGLMGLAMLVVQTRYTAREFQLMAASLFFHVVSTFVQLWLVFSVYRTGDVIFYDRYGAELATMIWLNPISSGAEALRLLLQLDYNVPLFPEGIHPATGSMVAVSAFLQLFLGSSMAAVGLMVAGASWLGKIALYQSMKENIDERYHIRMLLTVMLVPSVVFWSGGMVKEAIAMIGVGLLPLAFGRLLRQRGLGSMLMLGLGALIVGLFKPHILFAMTPAAAAWLYWHRAAGPEGVRVRPLYLVGGAILAVVALYGLGELFPRFSLQSLGEELATAQSYELKSTAGSTYSIGNSLDRSLVGQLAFVPMALLTALFRPLVFEASNPQMFVNALESTGLLLLVLKAFATRGVGGVWRTINRQPILVFCLIYALAMGAAVGLVSSNLGTLSRYRMPMVPFFAALVLFVDAPQASLAAAVEPARRGLVGARKRAEPWVRPIDRKGQRPRPYQLE